MCLAAISIMALSALIGDEGLLKGWMPIGLVEAEIDSTFENDDVYAEYIKSARIQQALAAQ